MNASNRSDQEWLYALSGKLGFAEQQAALDELATHLYKIAYTYLLKRQVNLAALAGFAYVELAELAHDFVQEILERIMQDSYFLLTKYNGTGSFAGWMTQVICNQIASELRRPYWKRRDWISDENDMDTDDAAAMNPEIAAILTHVNQVLTSCLQKLTPRYRMVLIHCIVEGERAEVVAAELEITTNAVYMLVHRAKHRLRKCVLKSGLDSDVFGIF